jgi:hypothetical protein
VQQSLKAVDRSREMARRSGEGWDLAALIEADLGWCIGPLREHGKVFRFRCEL